MDTQKIEYPENLKLVWTNGTGANVPIHWPVVIKGRVYVTFVPINDGATGVVLEKGRYLLPKVSGTAFAQGDQLCWDAANSRLDLKSANPSLPSIGRCPVAALSGDAKAYVDLNEGVGVRFFNATVSSGQAAANSNDGVVSFDTGVVNPHLRCVVEVITASTGVKKTGYLIKTDSIINTQLNISGVAAGVQIDAGDIVNAIVF